LRPTDPQRILRALEVLEATGQSLASFQSARTPPLLDPKEALAVFLAPERDLLARRIEARFAAMLEAGALAEVEALRGRDLDPALPIMRAHGAPHLIRHLGGEMALAEAARRAVLDTRQYAKRQLTFARHQLVGFQWAAGEAAEALLFAALA